MFSDVNNFRKIISFPVFDCILKNASENICHFRVSRYFGHIIGSKVILVRLEVSMGILIIWKFRRYFGHFGVWRYLGHFIGFRVILVILKVLELFWSFC